MVLLICEPFRIVPFVIVNPVYEIAVYHNQMTIDELDANGRRAFLEWHMNLARHTQRKLMDTRELRVYKADLLPLNIRNRWADYFKAHDILYAFWSAKAATSTLEVKMSNEDSEEESASLDLDTIPRCIMYGRDELLMRLQAEAESIVAQTRTSTPEEDHDASSSDFVFLVAEHVVVWFVMERVPLEEHWYTPGKAKKMIISEGLTSAIALI
ncbi:unnamed protein product [Urochloa humidicola]